MRIDNSAAKLWFDCPWKYQIRYLENLEPISRGSDGLDFGTRWHELQASRNGVGVEHPLADPQLEAECQATFQAYLQHYGHEAREIVDVERTLVVPLNDRHELAFKIDLIFREPGGLAILDYKTEKRQSKYNTPEAWTAKAQVALYQWAAARHYGERITALYLDVTIRQSPKGNEPPLFQRQRLVRTDDQQAAGVANIIWIADQIESMQASGFWPTNTEHCQDGWKRCEYYQLCHIGRTDGNLRLYQPAKPYLDL